ncbi:hypothetical protein HK405_012355, partial [Cladochytrium tenue]
IERQSRRIEALERAVGSSGRGGGGNCDDAAVAAVVQRLGVGAAVPHQLDVAVGGSDAGCGSAGDAWQRGWEAASRRHGGGSGNGSNAGGGSGSLVAAPVAGVRAEAAGGYGQGGGLHYVHGVPVGAAAIARAHDAEVDELVLSSDALFPEDED